MPKIKNQKFRFSHLTQILQKKKMPLLSSKVTPADHLHDEGQHKSNQAVRDMKMTVISLHDLLKRHGGQRHPKIEPYEEFRDRGGTAKPFQPLRVRFKDNRERRIALRRTRTRNH